MSNNASSLSKFAEHTATMSVLRPAFTDFLQSLYLKIVDVKERQEDNPSLYSNFDYLPRYCQSLMDINQEAAINMMFFEWENIPYGSVKASLGDIILRNIDIIERTDVDDDIYLPIMMDLSKYDDLSLIPLIENNIKQIVYMRENDGWSHDNLEALKKHLITPCKTDIPRQKHVKETLNNEFFPAPQETVKAKPMEFHTFKDAHYFLVKEDLFDDDNTKQEIDMNDLKHLPITALFYEAYNQIFFTPEGHLKTRVKSDSFIDLGKAMDVMHDIAPDFTMGYLLSFLNNEFAPQSNEYAAYLIADFIHQRANYQYEKGYMDEIYFTHAMNSALTFLSLGEEQIQRNVTIMNIQGAIKKLNEHNEAYKIYTEQRKYLAPFKEDSDMQIEAKEIIASHIQINRVQETPEP